VGRIVITEFVSLDGVMEGPGGDNDFARGAWSFEFDRGDEGNKFKMDEVDDAAAFLLGRITYEGFAAAWPSREGEFADKFNSMPKYVVSKTLSDPEWANSTIISWDDVPKVRDSVDGNLYVHGSQKLAAALVANDLADELRLMVFPVVLGTGRRLFGETSESKTFVLESSQVAGDGVTMAVYRRAG
jgi:dihydrofolate reductase